MSAYSDAVLADSPVGYWRLGEASGAFVDSSGNGNNGAAVGSPTYGETGALSADSDKAVKTTQPGGLITG